MRMQTTASTVDEVKAMLGEVLGVTDRLDSMDASTRLLGSLPELDSMAIAELLAAIEETFGLQVDTSDLSIDMLETVGTLAAYVDENRP